MNIDFPTTLVAVTFASQILVCSFISASRFGKSAQLLRENYPPGEYPKLYPIAPEKMQRQQQQRNAVRLAIGVVATVVLIAGLARGIGPWALANHMIWVAMAQLLPTLLFLPQQLAMTKALRAMPAPAVRSADLRQWRVSDFVSPLGIALGITGSILAIAVSGYFFLRSPSPGLQLHIFNLAISALLLGRMLYVLLAPVVMARPDPYMTSVDVFRARRQRLRLLFRMAFVLGLYFTFMELYIAQRLHFEFFYVAIGVSVLCQMLSLRMTQMVQSAITERDLSPYRAEPANGPG